MKRTYKSQATAGPRTDYEVNTQISCTIPDQGMSVRTILERFASGTLSDIGQNAEYSEDNIDLRGLDISQVYDMRKQAREDANALEQAIKTEAREKRDAKNKKDREDDTPEAEIITE